MNCGTPMLLLFSHSATSNSLPPCGLQHRGFPVLHHLPELAKTHVHWVGDAIQPSCSLLSPSPPAFNLAQHQGLFQWVSSSHHVVKYWSFSFSINPSKEYSGLISFRIDWFDPLAVQGTLKSLFEHHSSKASVFQCSDFFYGPILTSIYDYRKNHSFDCMDLYWQNLCFLILCLGLS